MAPSRESNISRDEKTIWLGLEIGENSIRRVMGDITVATVIKHVQTRRKHAMLDKRK